MTSSICCTFYFKLVLKLHHLLCQSRAPSYDIRVCGSRLRMLLTGGKREEAGEAND